MGAAVRPATVRPAAGWLERLDEFAAGFLAAHGVPGAALAVVEGGATAFARAYGMRDRERGLPVEEDTVFGLASLTKSFTALTLLALQARGVLSLDDPVTRYLPGFAYPGIGADGPVRVWHLASHTSGLPPVRGLDYAIHPSQVGDPAERFNLRDYEGAPDVGDHAALLAYLAGEEVPALAAPGRVVSYSNDGYALLGAVIEAATGEPYPAVVAREVLAPLGMSGAGFDTEALRSTGRLTELYTPTPEGGVIHSPRWEEAPAYLATGFMKAGVLDLAAYLRYLLWPEPGALAVSPELLAQLHVGRGWAERFTSYGLGWMMREDYHGLSLWRHGGSLKGVSSHQGGVPSLGLGVAVLANVDEAPIKRLWHAAVNAYLGLPLDEPAFGRESEFAAATRLGPAAGALAGVYDSGEPWGRLELVVEGDRLLALVGEQRTPNGHVAMQGGREFVLVTEAGAWESGRFVVGRGSERPEAVQYGMRWYGRRPDPDG